MEQFLDQDLPEQVRLARRRGVYEIVDTVPQISGNERMLLRKMTRALYPEDSEVSRRLWLGVNSQTDRQAHALGIEEETFADIHRRTQNYFHSDGSPESLRALILSYRERTSPKGLGYRWNDAHQQSQTETRSLAQLQNTGIRISVPGENLPDLQGYYFADPIVPILETGKNSRIIALNGFQGALMTLAIHDAQDHFFISSLVRGMGLEERYSSFFDSMGNPHDTDLFSREGELIAAISYASRIWNMVEPGIKPDITAARTINLIKKTTDISNNQQHAVDFLEAQVVPDSEQARKYGYIVTSVVIELLEQRRKQGFIRVLDQNYGIVGSLPLVDSEYLALIVDVTRLLSESESAVRISTGNAGLLIEEYFHQLATNGVIQDIDSLPVNLQKRVVRDAKFGTALVLKIADLEDRSIREQSSLPPNITNWIYDHPEFTATQQYLSSTTV